MAEHFMRAIYNGLESHDKEQHHHSPPVSFFDARYYELSAILCNNFSKRPSATFRPRTSIVDPPQEKCSSISQPPGNKQTNSSQPAITAPLSHPASPSRDLPNGHTSTQCAHQCQSNHTLSLPSSSSDIIDLLSDSENGEDDTNHFSPTDSVDHSHPSQPEVTSRLNLPSLFDEDEETTVLDPATLCVPSSPRKPTKSTTSKHNLQKPTPDALSPKRRRTLKEVRGARYRPVPSRGVLERLNRCQLRLFLVQRETHTPEHVSFAVMGTNGNIYHCKVDVQPTCTCPDFQKRVAGAKAGPCKHLIFVFMRVLKVEREDPVWWQTRLLPSELRQILRSDRTCDEGVLADERVRKQFKVVTEGVGRRVVDGECPICYDELADADGSRAEDVTTWCRKCGNNFHKVCMQNWMQARDRAACPLCRMPFMMKEGTAESCVNLREYSSAHPRELTLAEMYQNTHEFIGRGRGRRGVGK